MLNIAVNVKRSLTHINNIKLFFGQEDILKYSSGIDSTSLLPKNLHLPFNKNHNCTATFAKRVLAAVFFVELINLNKWKI